MANLLTLIFGIFQKQQVLAVWCVVISHNRQRRFQEMNRCPIILIIYRYAGIWHIQCFHTRYVIKYPPIVMQIMFPFTQYHRSFYFYDINVSCLDIIELKVRVNQVNLIMCIETYLDLYYEVLKLYDTFYCPRLSIFLSFFNVFKNWL